MIPWDQTLLSLVLRAYINLAKGRTMFDLKSVAEHLIQTLKYSKKWNKKAPLHRMKTRNTLETYRLNHEALDDAVKYDPIIVTTPRVRAEVFHRLFPPHKIQQTNATRG